MTLPGLIDHSVIAQNCDHSRYDKVARTLLLYEIDNCDVIAGRRHVAVGLMRPTRRTLCGHWYEMALLTRDWGREPAQAGHGLPRGEESRVWNALESRPTASRMLRSRVPRPYYSRTTELHIRYPLPSPFHCLWLQSRDGTGSVSLSPGNHPYADSPGVTQSIKSTSRTSSRPKSDIRSVYGGNRTGSLAPSPGLARPRVRTATGRPSDGTRRANVAVLVLPPVPRCLRRDTVWLLAGQAG